MRAPSQSRRLGGLFAVLTAGMAAVAVAAATASQWIVAVAAAALAVWMGSLALWGFRG